MVERERHVPTVELTIAGQPGDVFSYEIREEDGGVVSGTSGEFGAHQREVVFTTGVLNAETEVVTISAQGRTGVPGKCVITTIQ